MKVFELKRKRAEEATKARMIVEQAVTEDRSLTEDEDTLVKGIEARIAGFDRQIAVMERVEAVESTPADARGHITGDDGASLLDGKVKYSLLRAYRQLVGMKDSQGGLEAEVSQEIGVRTNKKAQGLYIPWNLATHRKERDPNLERRVLTTTAGAGSIAAILGTDLIELLRNRMVMNQMGATLLNDMTGGTFSLPKQTSANTMYWVAEGTSPTGGNLNIGQVTWTPKTAGAFTDLTRKFLLQTNQDAEALARTDLAKVIAIGLDYAGLSGSGAGQQPLGIFADPSIAVYALGTNGAAPTWTMAVDMEKLVAQGNAEFGKLGYVTSNSGRAALKTTAKIGTTFPIFIWENDTQGDMVVGARGIVNGYRAMATQQIPSNFTKGSSGATLTGIIYGNFESATYAFWSGLDLLVDPYTGSSAGTVRFVALQDLDFQQRWEQSYAKCYDMIGG